MSTDFGVQIVVVILWREWWNGIGDGLRRGCRVIGDHCILVQLVHTPVDIHSRLLLREIGIGWFDHGLRCGHGHVCHECKCLLPIPVIFVRQWTEFRCLIDPDKCELREWADWFWDLFHLAAWWLHIGGFQLSWRIGETAQNTRSSPFPSAIAIAVAGLQGVRASGGSPAFTFVLQLIFDFIPSLGHFELVELSSMVQRSDATCFRINMMSWLITMKGQPWDCDLWIWFLQRHVLCLMRY